MKERANPRFHLVGILGQGGMADVYLAVRAGPHDFVKLVVVKQLRTKIGGDSDFLKMFLEEARLAARLDHPNIVATYEVGEENGENYIEMEFLDGQPFNTAKRSSSDIPMSAPAQIRVLIETLSALDYAHNLKDFDGTPMEIVHRDISPQNVFVTYDGRVKLVDFGIAKALGSSVETRTGIIKGKASYMAPEQARGERIDTRADLYSVGIMLWEALTDRRPWNTVDTNHIVYQHIIGNPVDFSQLRELGVSPLGEEILTRALAKDREERYPTALAMRADLERLLREDFPNDTSSLRQIGEDLTRHFADHRARVRQRVEEAISGVRARPNSVSDLSSFELPRSVVRAIPRADDHDEAIATVDDNKLDMTPFSRAAGRRRRAIVGGIVAVLVVVGVVLTLRNNGDSTSPSAEQTTAASVSPGSTGGSAERTPAADASSAESAPADLVSIDVRSTPAGSVTLDGRPIGSTPLKIQHARDDASHQLRVEAVGYTAHEQTISLDDNRSFSIVLPKREVSRLPGMKGKARGGAASSTSHSATTASADPARRADTPKPPVKDKSRGVVLDDENPWAK